MAMSRRRRFFWIGVGLALVASFTAAVLGGLAYFVQQQGLSSSARKSDAGANVLSITLDGSFDENPSPSFQLAISGGSAPSFPAVIRAIDRAASEPNLKSVFVRIGEADLGWARAGELREALLRLRAKGKKLTAFLEDSGNMEYYIASCADEIVALPEAILQIHGLSAEVMFLKGAFDKLGVEAQFVAMGKYKNAPNQYTEKKFTAAHREQMGSLVGGLYREYISAVAKSRKKTEAEIEAMISAGPYDGGSALEAGLVDKLDYPEEALEAVGDTHRYLGDFRDQGGAFDTRPRGRVDLHRWRDPLWRKSARGSWFRHGGGLRHHRGSAEERGERRVDQGRRPSGQLSRRLRVGLRCDRAGSREHGGQEAGDRQHG